MSVPGSDWPRLFRIACSLIRQVNSEHVIIDSWALGGGTAMMLQINHRRSDDIDIFLPDAQLLPYLDPKLRDFDFEVTPSDYQGDGSRFLKLAFEGLGEIDFIVSPTVTSMPTTQRTIEGETSLWKPSPRSSRRKFIFAVPPSSRATSSTLRQPRGPTANKLFAR